MVNPSGPPSVLAQSNSAKDSRRGKEFKAAIVNLGTGKDARVRLMLRDGESVSGYVHETQEDGFSVSNFCSGVVIPVPFAQVRGLRGVNVATGTKVSAGKGVSKGVDAVLAASEPCGMVVIGGRGRPSSRSRTIIIVAAFAVLATAVALIAYAVYQEHNQ